MRPDPITAFGLFVLRLFRRPAKSYERIRGQDGAEWIVIADAVTAAEMATLRRALMRQIERDEVRHG